MGVVSGDPSGHQEPDIDAPLTVELLADLQAGLLDDATAARLRKRIREDPMAAQTLESLERVRRDLAALGREGSPAACVPCAVVDRIGAALRALRPPDTGRRIRSSAAHAAAPGGSPVRVAAAIAGLLAAVIAAGLGVAALIDAPTPMSSEPTTVRHVTVSRAPMPIPASEPEILALLDHKPDYGPLGDPQRRASCLAGLGYPVSVHVLGAKPVQIAGRPAVLLVLPDDTPGTLAVLAVAPSCSSADTGLLASRHVRRP